MSILLQLTGSSTGSIPSVVLPWLSMVLVAVCLWCMIVVIWRIMKGDDQLTKIHLSLIVLCISTIVFLGFGADAVRTILAYQDSIRTILALDDPEAGTEDLEIAINKAPNDADRELAYEVFGRHNPEAALEWYRDPENEVLRKRPELRNTLQQKEASLQAAIDRDQPELIEWRAIRINDPGRLQRLLTLARSDPAVAERLEMGKYNLEALDPEQVNLMLRQAGAIREGNIITFSGERPFPPGGG